MKNFLRAIWLTLILGTMSIFIWIYQVITMFGGKWPNYFSFIITPYLLFFQILIYVPPFIPPPALAAIAIILNIMWLYFLSLIILKIYKKLKHNS